MIMTLRESDAGTWNTEEMAEYARSFSLDALGFSVGGIMASYPSDIPLHPRAKTLGERDLAAEMIASLAKRGIRPIASIDPSMASRALYAERPEWFAQDKTGGPVEVHGHFVTCPNGGYYNDFMIRVVEEILTRYAFDVGECRPVLRVAHAAMPLVPSASRNSGRRPARPFPSRMAPVQRVALRMHRRMERPRSGRQDAHTALLRLDAPESGRGILGLFPRRRMGPRLYGTASGRYRAGSPAALREHVLAGPRGTLYAQPRARERRRHHDQLLPAMVRL
jgi:hypothetical protein